MPAEVPICCPPPAKDMEDLADFSLIFLALLSLAGLREANESQICN